MFADFAHIEIRIDWFILGRADVHFKERGLLILFRVWFGFSDP
jgi:hypothetical protein